MSKLLAFIFIFLIRVYKGAISPMFSPCCRYTPSCSEYGIQAIKIYGPFKGGLLTLKRIFSCHPWGGNGHDPVT